MPGQLLEVPIPEFESRSSLKMMTSQTGHIKNDSHFGSKKTRQDFEVLSLKAE